MVSMKKLFFATATVANAGANVDHVSTTASHIGESHLDREVEVASPSGEECFTSRGHYGSSRIEEPEWERQEVDCSQLKGNQTLPEQCSVFANATQFEKIAVTNSTSTSTVDCMSLTGMARIQCLGLKTQPIDCSKFKGSSTMPYECAVQFGMVSEETKIPETIILEEAKVGDELTWDKAFNTMFPELMKSPEQEDSIDSTCFSCDILTTLLPADSFFGRLATKANDVVKSVFDEPKLSVDDVLDCSMQLGNKTMTAECTEALDSEFVYYRGGNSTVAQEPKISPLGFIVEEIDCEALALKGDSTLPWQCMQQKNSTATTNGWFW